MGTIVLGTSVAWGVQSLGDFSRWVLGSWGVGSWGVGSWGVGSQGGRVMGGRIATLLRPIRLFVGILDFLVMIKSGLKYWQKQEPHTIVNKLEHSML